MNGDQQRMLPSVPSRKSSVYLDELPFPRSPRRR